MKTWIITAIIITVGVIIATKYREDMERQAHLEDIGEEVDESPEDEYVDSVDDVILNVLSHCMEAYCEDCSMVLAQGTHPYHDKVAAVAYAHGETFDHEVLVRTWAE